MENTEGIRRSLLFLLIAQLVGAFLVLLAGSTLVAHVDPLSECVIFAWQEEESLSYGNYYVCDIIGYGFIFINILVFVTAYITLRQRSSISSLSKHFSMRNLSSLKIGKRLVVIHFVILMIVTTLTMVLTVGYKESCEVFNDHVTKLLTKKINTDPQLLAGETLEDRFVDDPMFWRYVQRVTNVFGSNLYPIKTSCRGLFTDPTIATLLHDNHVTKYSDYFGWWYHQDIYSFDAQSQAIKTNVLIEASLAGSWLSTLVWLGATIFVYVQRRRLAKQSAKARADAVDSTSLRSDRSAASTYQRGSIKPGSSPASSIRIPGNVYSSVTSNASSYNRKDIDDLALGSILDPNFYRNNRNNNIIKIGKSSRRRSGSLGHLQMQIQSQPLLIGGRAGPVREHFETEIM